MIRSRQLSQVRAKPLAEAFHTWILAQRERVLDGYATANALDFAK